MAVRSKILSIAGFAFLTCIILGIYSVRPFTKLLIPWILYSQWSRSAYPAPTDQNCLEQLRSTGTKASLIELPAIEIDAGCVIDTPVLIDSLAFADGDIGFNRPITLSCPFALKFREFVETSLIEQATKAMQARPVKLMHIGSYACRGQRSLTVIKSSHAFGEAIDMAGLEFANGRRMYVEYDYYKNDAAGQLLHSIAEKACTRFGTTLGPPFDNLHRNHLHIATGFPDLCRY